MNKQLELLSEKINQITQKVTENISDNNKTIWLESEKKLKRAIKQFDGEKNFIIVTGMLKAGKSTLIDLLARTTKASLVGFGVDTTLRPAVIKTADNETGQIKVYYKPNGTDWATAMQDVTDYMRGIKEYDKQTVNFDLTEDNLRKTLCRTPQESDNCLSTEPLLVVVEVPQNPESKFFSNNCILLDMPGLDSGYSEQSKDPEKYQAFFDECDLLLFVQSSVSPINNKAGEYLKYIGLTRDESTYRLVQNVMNAKYWLKKEETDKEQKKQAKNGREVFKEKLGKNNVEITPVYVNLGMAYDSILGNQNFIYTSENEDIEIKKKKLLDDSHFLEMEDSFITDIKNNGQHRHIAHCKDMLKQEILKTIKKLEDQSEDISTNITKLNSEKQKNEEKILIIKKSYEGYKFKPIQFALSNDFVNNLKQKIIYEFELIRKSIDYKNKLFLNAEDENTDKLIRGKASNINSFLEKCSTRAKQIAEDLFSKAYLDDLVHKENGKEKNAIEYSQEDLKEKAENLKLHGITLNGEKISDNINKIGEIDNTFSFSIFDGGKYVIERNWLGFQKKIDFSKNSKYEEIINHYKNELEKIISTDDYVARKITSLVQNTIKQDLTPQLSEYQKELTIQEQKINTLNNDKSTITDILRQLKELQIN